MRIRMKNNKKSINAGSTVTVDLNEVAKSLVIERSRAVLIDKIEQIIYKYVSSNEKEIRDMLAPIIQESIKQVLEDAKFRETINKAVKARVREMTSSYSYSMQEIVASALKDRMDLSEVNIKFGEPK